MYVDAELVQKPLMRKIQKPQNVWENHVGQEEKKNNNNEIKDGECVKSGGVAVR
jgi:hypothetical protein